jgi:hypothetical protein
MFSEGGIAVLSILGRTARLCDGLTRREVLRIGGLAFTGLTWPGWLHARSTRTQERRPRPGTGGFGKARACIIIFNYGGPSHLDIWDLKPNAPPEIRGTFKPIATRVSGLSITEHLPRLAQVANHYTVVRSVTHRDNDHAVGTYLTLTGYSHPRSAILGIEPPASAQDMPSLGSVVSRLRPPTHPVFAYVTLGDLRHFGNHDSLGQNGGCLGHAYDPFTIPFVRPGKGELDLGRIASVLAQTDRGRMGARRQLRQSLDQAGPALPRTTGMHDLDGFTQRAYDLLATAGRDALNLAKEPPRIRDAYGAEPFAENCLRARRLVEAGVPLVTVYQGNNRDWDTHSQNFSALKQTLLPIMDRGVSALLVDLHQRGLLEETLVLWMSDMGRTPRINRDAGRDHWSFCYSLLIAGGGIRGGQVYGASDRFAAYPSTNPVSPAEVAATIYHCLGIDPRTQITDQQGRPLVIGTGSPISTVLA